jgi:hypothetical protein
MLRQQERREKKSDAVKDGCAWAVAVSGEKRQYI